jgi:hypothetical protein
MLKTISSYLKVIGCLYILGAPIDWCLFLVEVCHAMVFSRVGRIADGDGEIDGWKFDGPRLTQPPAYHECQSASLSAEA